MDESNLASKALSGSEDSENSDAEDSSNMKGRFRNPTSDKLELDSSLTDDEEKISRMAKRFRGPGAKLSEADSQPSFDSQSDDGDDVSDDELQNFLLDALDGESGQSDASDDDHYVLEEVDDRQSPRATAPQSGPAEQSSTPPNMAHADTRSEQQGLLCPSCHATNPAGMRFCVQCGGSLKDVSAPPTPTAGEPEPQRDPPPPSEAAKQENPWDIHLVSINEDGSDGISVPLEYLETTLGRDGDTRFPTDAFLSPKHARIHIDDGQVSIEDLYSLNGTFLQLRDEVRLVPGDSFLMGRQVLRFERFDQSITSKTKSSDGTRYMGSPAPGGEYKLLQIGIGNVVQNVYCLPGAGAVLGREKGDIIFPHDKFMSSRHAQIYSGEDDQCYLVDLNSSNGTWSKLWEKTNVENGDYIFMGQQLFRIHIGKDA